MSIIKEIAASIYRSGFRKLVLMNSHGGQPQIMEIAARDIHQEYQNFAVFPLFTWRVPHMVGVLLTAQEQEYGIHAGDAETSIMLFSATRTGTDESSSQRIPPRFTRK